MNCIKMCALTAGLLLVSEMAFAQFSISPPTPAETSTRKRQEPVKQVDEMYNPYFSESQWLAEKKRIRNERNTVELNSALMLNQNSYVNWAPGGDNTFAGRAEFFFRHQYKREKLAIEYRLEAKYGVSYIDSKSFKNQDLLLFNASWSWRIKNNWSYTASVNFRTQFAQGFKSRNDNTLISDFMAPGVLDLAVGFTYRKLQSPFSFNISPIGGSMTYVLNNELSRRGAFGVEPGRHQISTLGSSVRADYDKEFAKKILRYRGSLYMFTNYSSNTYARWDNTLEIKATRYLAATLNATTVYDQYAETPEPQKLQFNYSIGIGLSYKFKNK